MGFFKKIFRPISKVLDKVIPNELKPALPYLAAFAPYMLPGTGIFASMAGRGFGSAAANLVGQLAQEGNEGEVNPLSLLLAGAQGAATAPNAGAKLRGMINKGKPVEIPGGNMPGQGMGGFKYDTSGLTGLDKAKNFALRGGAKLADLAGDAKDILQNPFDEGVTLEQITSAGATPFSQASGDVLYGEAVRQKKDYEREEARRLVEEEMRQRGLDQSYIDSVIASMTAYGYTQEEIDAILELQGYEGLARGGRVGARQGGLLASLINSGPTTQLAAQRPIGNFQPFMGRPAFEPLQQAEAVFPRLNQLEQGVNQAEQSLGSIRKRLGNQPRQLLSASQGPMSVGLQPLNNPFLQSQAPVGTLRSQQELYKEGGRIGLMDGGEPDFISMKEVVDNVNADEITEGIMSANYQKGGSVLPPGMEMDYRGGGMIPMGSKERADDVPARVSKNEFVMTADAVRAAGGGSVNKGAQRMYQLMNNLEARA